MNTTTATQVRDRVSPMWTVHLNDELLNIDANSEVGARCITLCGKADELLALMDEGEPRYGVEVATADQCHVWYFG